MLVVNMKPNDVINEYEICSVYFQVGNGKFPFSVIDCAQLLSKFMFKREPEWVIPVIFQ